MRILDPAEFPQHSPSGGLSEVLPAAALIVDDVRIRGESAVREHAERLGDVPIGGSLWMERGELASVQGDSDTRALLDRTAARIAAFASAQLSQWADLDVEVPGGRAGHRIAPVERAGCYAPGGRHPLPSSALMTAVTARVAGVREVWLASPRPAPVTLLACQVAGADGVLLVGGAQAVAAMAYGIGPMSPCDVVVGPGNIWVTAAKKLVSGDVGIDMLAGPSELVVLADASADPQLVAADLLAQAEHDTLARPWLVTNSRALAEETEAAWNEQLDGLPTRGVAALAGQNGGIFVTKDWDEAIRLVDRIAPEHLEIFSVDPRADLSRIAHFGGAFLGSRSAEVFGDYGIGPNHTLPTGGTARFSSGLNVSHFLRQQTWLELDDPGAVLSDVTALARLEGLEAHARAAERRYRTP